MIRHHLLSCIELSDKKLPLVEIQGLLKEKVLLLFLLKFQGEGGRFVPPPSSQVPTALSSYCSERNVRHTSFQASCCWIKQAVCLATLICILGCGVSNQKVNLISGLLFGCNAKVNPPRSTLSYIHGLRTPNEGINIS